MLYGKKCTNVKNCALQNGSLPKRSFSRTKSAEKHQTDLFRPRPNNLSRGCRAQRGAKAGSRPANLKMPPQSLRIDTRRVTCRRRQPMAALRRRPRGGALSPLRTRHRQCTRTRRLERTYAARARNKYEFLRKPVRCIVTCYSVQWSL